MEQAVVKVIVMVGNPMQSWTVACVRIVLPISEAVWLKTAPIFRVSMDGRIPLPYRAFSYIARAFPIPTSKLLNH